MNAEGRERREKDREWREKGKRQRMKRDGRKTENGIWREIMASSSSLVGQESILGL